MRNSFVFYGSWWEAIKNLQRDVQGDVLTAIIEYGLSGETTEQLKPIAKAMLAMVKPQIDANNQRFENGKKGGRKKIEQNQVETNQEPNQNQNVTKQKPNANQTETYNVNVDDNVDDNNIPPTPPKGDGKGENPSNPPNPASKRKPANPTSLNGKARKVFEEHFKATFDSDYYWTAKDAGNMTALLQKIQFSRTQRGMQTDDNSMLEALKAFLMSVQDGWLFDNFSVPNLNSKYNEVISQAKQRHGPNTGIILRDNSTTKYDNDDERWKR